ncbi:testis-expressed protein 36 [Corapipo altera]|uniref:testis-expressed protein 36 n=1 Tax=Corapipo altera TaxID=415028 RepID=UPI000FD6355F|nr:testis-expressed protein 36 [Corapipo altera]
MSQDRWTNPRERRPGDWFAHVGECQDEFETTTSAALRHVLDSTAAQGIDHRLPLEYKARDPKAGNKNFPFSSHDNKHSLCNAAEYFDLGMGLKKLDPEKQQGSSTNFFEWAHESIPSSEDGLTIYQTSFVIDENNENTEGPWFRRFPKHHGTNWCIEQPVLENAKNLQPDKSS